MKRHMLVVGMVVAAAGMSAQAQVFNEAGDAGDMPVTAQQVAGAGAVTDIFGTVNGLFDADMFVIDITNPAAFSATTDIASGTMGDTTLYLFNMNGTGIAKHDDLTNTNFLSGFNAGNPLYASLAPGQYILAVGGFAFAPYYTGPTTLADLIFDINNFTGVIGPQAGAVGQPILGWANAGAYSQGTYHITLSGASFVPAPTAATVLGAGLLLGARRRRA